MKIYFGFTVAGDRSSMEAARKIVELVVQMGHEVLTGHLLRDDAWEADRLITPQEVYRGTCDGLHSATCLWLRFPVLRLAWALKLATFSEPSQKTWSCSTGGTPKEKYLC